MTTWTTQCSDDTSAYANGDRPDLNGLALNNGLGGAATRHYAYVTGGPWFVDGHAIQCADPAVHLMTIGDDAPRSDVRVGACFQSNGQALIARYAGGHYYELYSSTGALTLISDAGVLSAYFGEISFTYGPMIWLECEGNQIRIYSDTTLLKTYTDPSVTGPGLSGLYGEATNTYFNNFSLQIPVTTTPTKLGITTQPAGAVSGVAFTTQPVVAVEASDNSTVTSDTSTVVATLVAVSGSGTLSGTTSKAAVSGVATFTNLVVTGAGAFQITFSDGSLTTVTSATFYVGVTQLAITSAPTEVITEQDITVVVAVQNAGGVTATGNTSTVTIAPTMSAGPFLLTSGSLSAAAVAGVATITFQGKFAQIISSVQVTMTLAATDGALTGASTAAIPTKVESLKIPVTVT